MTDFNGFRGAAKRLDNIDLPRIGAEIGVGEDIIHALIDVEAAGEPFDKQGRPKMLFEPHIFYRHLKGAARARAVAAGLAYPKWRRGNYPSDSYPRLQEAMAIDETAALMSASWGASQIMGFNHVAAGYKSPQDMVRDFMDDAANHIEAMVKFIVSTGIDDELRRIEALNRPSKPDDWRPVALPYNGKGYEDNGYHTKLSKAFNRWRGIPDTPWSPDAERGIDAGAGAGAAGAGAGAAGAGAAALAWAQWGIAGLVIVGALAVGGYLIWRNRARIAKLFKKG